MQQPAPSQYKQMIENANGFSCFLKIIQQEKIKASLGIICLTWWPHPCVSVIYGSAANTQCFQQTSVLSKQYISGLILGLRQANERRRYFLELVFNFSTQSFPLFLRRTWMNVTVILVSMEARAHNPASTSSSVSASLVSLVTAARTSHLADVQQTTVGIAPAVPAPMWTVNPSASKLIENSWLL